MSEYVPDRATVDPDNTLQFRMKGLRPVRGAWLVVLVAIAAVIASSTTALADDMSGYDELVHRWAPVIFQDVDTDGALGRRPDFMTRWDYDGDLNPDNNWDNLGAFPLEACVYYSVQESQTHYFIGYYVYHPRDWVSSKPAAHEHDLEGVMLVVSKPGTALSDLVLSYTEAHDDAYFFSNESLTIPNYPLDAGSWLSGDHLDGLFGFWDAGLITGENRNIYFSDGRPAVFIEALGHGIGQIRRALVESGSGFDFSGTTYAFHGADGVRYTPSSTSQSAVPDADDAGAQSIEYKLLPLRSWFWDYRHDSLFSDLITITTNRGIVLPRMGYTFSVDVQDPGAHAPWGWPEYSSYHLGLESVLDSERGDFFLDPAEFVSRIITDWAAFQDTAFSSYLSNVYLAGDNSIELSPIADTFQGDSVDIGWNHSEASGGTGLDSTVHIYLIDSSGRQQIGTAATTAGAWTWNPVAVDSPGPYSIEITCDSAAGSWLHVSDAVPVSIESGQAELYCSEVSRPEGDTGDSYIFEAAFLDPGGNPPGSARVVIDGMAHVMEIDGSIDWISGTDYALELSGLDIGPGSHSYYYEFRQGSTGDYILCPASGSYSGPTITSRAPSVSVSLPQSLDPATLPALCAIDFQIDDPDSGDDSYSCNLYWDTDNNPDNGGLRHIVGPLTYGRGSHRYEWDMSGLPEGFYYVRLAAADQHGVAGYSYSSTPVYLGSHLPCLDSWTTLETQFHLQAWGYHAAAVDETGQLNVAYPDASFGDTLYFTKSYWDGWSDPTVLAICPEAANRGTGLAVDGDILDLVFCRKLDRYEIRHMRSLDGGDTWGEEHAVTANDDVYSRSPELIRSGMTLHLAWYDNMNGSLEQSIRYARSTSSGQTWTDFTHISDTSIPVDVYDGLPVMAAHEDHVTIAWAHEDAGGVFARHSNDGGVSWSSIITLQSEENVADARIVSDGAFVYVVWGLGDPAYMVFMAKSSDYGACFGEATPVPTGGCYSEPSILSLDGKLIVTAECGESLFFTTSTDGGQTWCEPVDFLSSAGDNHAVAVSGPDHAYLFAVRGNDQNRLVVHVTPELGSPPPPLPVFFDGFEAEPRGDNVLLSWRLGFPHEVSACRLWRRSGQETYVIPIPQIGVDNVYLDRAPGSCALTYDLEIETVNGQLIQLGSASVAARVLVPSLRGFPNPLNPGTQITYTLPRAGDIDLVVYDLQGRRVRRLASGFHVGGDHSVYWDGRNDGGASSSSGIYFVRLRTDRTALTRKLVILK